jgi:hypothetical protein
MRRDETQKQGYWVFLEEFLERFLVIGRVENAAKLPY